jgi:hypothetical protein
MPLPGEASAPATRLLIVARLSNGGRSGDRRGLTRGGWPMMMKQLVRRREQLCTLRGSVMPLIGRGSGILPQHTVI